MPVLLIPDFDPDGIDYTVIPGPDAPDPQLHDTEETAAVALVARLPLDRAESLVECVLPAALRQRQADAALELAAAK